jgi:predicted ATPase
MRLSRIEIENFKGIGRRQAADLKPITLLFGPNSVGKSTILQALHYLREILERGNIDPDVTIAGGLIDLGGFATLVHNHELGRAVRLKVAMDLSDEQGAEALGSIDQRAGILRVARSLPGRRE